MGRWEKLVEITRGGAVESEHWGALVVADADGHVLHAVGDPAAVVFARSALKPFQALPTVASGAADAFGFDEADLALLCASHSGEAVHVSRVAGMLARIGCTAADLQCGVHPPLHLAPGDPAPPEGIGPLHHNCSGKHTGFLAWCRHHGAPCAAYLNPDSPVQREVRRAVAACAGVGESALVGATDGCDAPTYALPLHCLARAYARLAARPGGRPFAPELDRLFRAMTGHPYLVAGSGRNDSFLMTRRPGELVAKGGAEGVQALGLRLRGIGIAVKIADGNSRAAGLATFEALLQLGVLDAGDLDGAPAALARELRNAPGRVTGEARAVFRLAS